MTLNHSQSGSPNLPFILFSPERTGSTTLARLMNRHPAILCEFEPFNPGYSGPVPFLCRTLLQSQGIAAAVDSLWNYSTRNGFKHVRRADGWPFPGQAQLNDWLLINATASILLLARRNNLQRAISGQVSAQMGIWVFKNQAERQRIRDHKFAPLDIAALRTEIQGERAEFQRTAELAASTGKPWRQFYYEDFFAPGLPMAARMDTVQSIFDFLSLPRVTDPQRLAAMQWLLDPANTSFQNIEAYGRIPNIHEVERELGNAENGHVFEHAARGLVNQGNMSAPGFSGGMGGGRSGSVEPVPRP